MRSWPKLNSQSRLFVLLLALARVNCLRHLVFWLATNIRVEIKKGREMAYLTEARVRKAARDDIRVIQKSMDSSAALRESVLASSMSEEFDVFLCHSIRDAELVQGAKKILEEQNLSVYVDWIVDPKMDRSEVSAKTAETLRSRMKKSSSLLYLFSNNSKRSRWMPWELGYFDGLNGTVGILPIVPDTGYLDFSQEEYLGLYPKIDIAQAQGGGEALFVNRTNGAPVENGEDYRNFKVWVKGAEKLRP